MFTFKTSVVIIKISWKVDQIVGKVFVEISGFVSRVFFGAEREFIIGFGRAFLFLVEFSIFVAVPGNIKRNNSFSLFQFYF